MKIYNYDSNTKEYIGESEARPDPLEEGKYLIPAHATTIEPIQKQENKAVIFNGESWELADDYRGKVLYKKENRQEYTIKDLDELPDYELYTEIEPIGNVEWDSENNEWKAIKPIASGKGLVQFIENTHSELTRDEVKILLDKLKVFFLLLNQVRCNPLLESDLNEEVLNLSTELTEKENTVINQIINTWIQTVRFA